MNRAKQEALLGVSAGNTGSRRLALKAPRYHSLTRPERIGAVEFRPYVPAADILPAADWTICHGGQNTIAQSLLHNVPLLMFPGLIFERRYNAAKTQPAGAGQL